MVSVLASQISSLASSAGRGILCCVLVQDTLLSQYPLTIKVFKCELVNTGG